ncbi:hypothetical protein ACLKA7_007287 [Drosophila subpalustris]
MEKRWKIWSSVGSAKLQRANGKTGLQPRHFGKAGSERLQLCHCVPAYQPIYSQHTSLPAFLSIVNARRRGRRNALTPTPTSPPTPTQTTPAF